MIVQRLRAIQNRYGYLPDAQLEALASEAGVPLYKVEELSSFFPAFRMERDKPAVVEVRVCRDMTCHHRGAERLLAAGGPLQALAADARLNELLEQNAPGWAAAERARQAAERARQGPGAEPDPPSPPAGKGPAAKARDEYPDPEPGRCRVAVAGVSCLGRCDRAPAVWVERHPMPAPPNPEKADPPPEPEHAWVFARRADETEDGFRDRLVGTIRDIAAGRHPHPDSDAGYEPHTNADLGYARPPAPPGQAPAHPPPGSARWEIDPYHGKDRDYAAVRQVATALKATGGLPPWPDAAAFRAWFTRATPEEAAGVEQAVRRAVGKDPGLTPARQAEVAAAAREREEVRVGQERFFRDRCARATAKEKAGVEKAAEKAAEEARGAARAAGRAPTPEEEAAAAAAAAAARKREEARVGQDVFIREANPALARLGASRLGGMGGAGAPAYQKRLDVWQQAGPDKYVVANGDESEPGTFKDREIMLRLPHLVVEGVILSGLMCGATAGHVFVRHEYPEQIHALKEEVKRAAALGACGADLFGTGLAFPVEVFESPGGYICGEQSALLEAMEDRRAQPRNRPPDLTSNGYKDRPTVLNNVETLAWVPSIVLHAEGDGPGYADRGWPVPAADGYGGRPPRFGGRRLLSVSGDVARPGVYEVPIGLPLGELLASPTYCGGLPRGLAAVATSGPSGGFLPATFPLPGFRARFDKYLARKRGGPRPADTSLAEWYVARHLPAGAAAFDLRTAPLDLGFFGLMKELFGLPVAPLLGAGLVVYGEGTDVLDAAANFTRFFRNESCGKCVPCRIGSQKLVQIGDELLAARRGARGGLPQAAADAVRPDIEDLAAALTQTSICSLGTSAPTPLASALAYFHPTPAARP